MFTTTATLVFYNFILVTCVLLCRNHTKKNRIPLYVSYIILWSVSIFRYDIGADYENYAEGIIELVNAFKIDYSLIEIFTIYEKEPGIVILSYLFSWSEYPFIWIIGCMSTLQLWLVYKLFDRYAIHTMGILIYLISFIYFQSFDWVRQATAMTIFLYGIKYIELKKVYKYAICVLCAGMFHYSAIFLLFFYFIRKLHPKFKNISIVVFVFFLFSQVGAFNYLHSLFNSLLFIYNPEYMLSDHSEFGVGTYHTTTFILTMIWFQGWLFLSYHNKRHDLSLLFAVGIVFYAISGGNLVVDRVAFYFTSIQLIIIPITIKRIKKKKTIKLFVRTLILIQFVIFNYVYIGAGFRGCSPYESIFSNNCKNIQFRFRDY